MAGTSKVFKENETIFRMGDAAQSMYIVRKGNLRVFIPKGNEEISLAALTDGAIVGEMAFFDNKPRSASVKATTPTEVVEITKADFDKLLTQLPKWVVTMMQSLVSRIRQTNDKLQVLESEVANQKAIAAGLVLPHQRHPFQHVLKTLRLLSLSLAKDGEKEGTHMVLKKEATETLWNAFIDCEPALFQKIMGILQAAKFIELKQDSRRADVIVFLNRGVLSHFTEFLGLIAPKLSLPKPFVSPAAISLLQALVETAISSGYDSLNVSLKNLSAAAREKKQDTSQWETASQELLILPDFKITSSPNDQTFRVSAKEHKSQLAYLKHMQAFLDAKLA